MQRRAILITFLSVVARFLWSLDANPLLFIYDICITRSSIAVGIIGNDVESRRIFHFQPSTSLDGKTVWITGASSGIGAELALQLSSVGVSHLILSGRRREKLETVADSCRKASENQSRAWNNNNIQEQMQVSIVPFDMSEGPDTLDKAVDTALQAANPLGIDILILNAGQYQCSSALDTNLDVAVPDLMQINFASPVQLSQKLIQKDHWKERKRGHIVTVASLMGRGASPLNAVYSSSKHALRAYFQTLAAEEKSWLRVDVVLPGATDTGLWDGSSTRGITDDYSNHNTTPKHPLHADDRSKMSVHRCARLIISSMIGPSFLFFETWITRNPGLLWVYLASYEPTTFHFLTTYVLAPLRVDMWRKSGEDALYLPTILRHLWTSAMDYIFSGTRSV